MPRRTRAEVRHRVVEAAAAVFAEKGIAATRIQDVAATAEFTRGAVYSDFADKADLLARWSTPHRTGWPSTAPPCSARPSRRARCARASAAWWPTGCGNCRCTASSSWNRWPRPPGTNACAPPWSSRAAAAAATAYFAGRGMPLPLPADLFATTLLAVVNAFAIELLIDPEGTTPTAVADALSVLVPG